MRYVGVGVQEVAAVDLQTPDLCDENQRAVWGFAAADLANVGQILEHTRDSAQDGAKSFAPLIRLVGDGAAEYDVLGAQAG